MPNALIAEDEPSLRALLDTYLTSAGYAVTTVGDGAAAVTALLNGVTQFAVAVVDCDMPLMTGPQALSWVRKAGCWVPVVVVSGLPQPDVVAYLAGDPLSTFLPKPFTLDQLVKAIAAVVGGGKT